MLTILISFPTNKRSFFVPNSINQTDLNALKASQPRPNQFTFWTTFYNHICILVGGKNALTNVVYDLKTLIVTRVTSARLIILQVNLFILALSIQPYSNDPLALPITRATGSLLQGLRDGMPFTDIIAFYTSQGLECTVDDLLAWSSIFIQQGTLRPENINNNTGIFTLSANSPYNNIPELAEIHYQAVAQMNYNVPLDTSSTENTGEPRAILNELKESTPTADLTNSFTDLSESIGPGLGFLLSLALTVICSMVIENLKTYFGVRTGDDDDDDDTESRFE